MFNFRGQNMKRLLLAGVALSVATAASAADMQARPYTKAPPAAVVAMYNWSGFYIGAMGGYGWDSGNSSGGFGGGLEYLFTPNWSAKGEYMFTSLGSKTYNLGGDLFDSGTIDFHTIKVGVNYHFR